MQDVGPNQVYEQEVIPLSMEQGVLALEDHEVWRDINPTVDFTPYNLHYLKYMRIRQKSDGREGVILDVERSQHDRGERFIQVRWYGGKDVSYISTKQEQYVPVANVPLFGRVRMSGMGFGYIGRPWARYTSTIGYQGMQILKAKCRCCNNRNRLQMRAHYVPVHMNGLRDRNDFSSLEG